MMETKEYEIRRLHEETITQAEQVRRLATDAAELGACREELARLREEAVQAADHAHRVEVEKNDALIHLEGRGLDLRELEAALQQQRNEAAEQAERVAAQAAAIDAHEDLGRRCEALEAQAADARRGEDEARAEAERCAAQVELAAMEDERGKARAAELELLLEAQGEKADALLAQLGDRSVQIDELQERSAQLESDENATAEQLSRLRGQHTAQGRELARLKEANGELLAARREHHGEQQRSSLAVSQLEGELSQARLDLKLERDRLANATERADSVPRLATEAAQLRGEVESVSAAFAEKTAEVNTRTQECLNLKVRIRSLEATASRAEELQGANTELAARNTALQAEAGGLRRGVEERDRRAQERDLELKAKAEVAATLQDQAARAADELVGLHGRVADLSADRDRLAAVAGRLAASEADVRSKAAALDESRAHADALRARVSELEETVAVRTGEVERLQALRVELDSNTDTIAQLQREAETNRRLQGDLRGELEDEQVKNRKAGDELQRSIEARYAKKKSCKKSNTIIIQQQH